MLTALPGKKLTDEENTNLEAMNIALLGAFCLFLSAIEYMIPKPLPFFRIGLANLPLMLALYIFPIRSFFILVCIKVFGQALITGTLFSYIFLFSFTGTFLSAFIMYFLRCFIKQKYISFIGIGTAGAVVSNLSQLTLAYVFIFKENVRYIAPAFIAAGLITGIILSIFCEVFSRRSIWYKNILSSCKDASNQMFAGQSYSSNVSFTEQEIKGRLLIYNNLFSAKSLFIAGFLIMPALLFNPSTEYRCFQFLFFLFLAWLTGKKINFLFTILIMAFIITFNLIIPYGKILFNIGALKITSGALEAGIHRAVTLQALVMLSKFTIRQDLKLPGAFGQLLGESMRIFSLLLSRKRRKTEAQNNVFNDRINRKNLIAEIDNLMLEVNQTNFIQMPIQETKTKPVGLVILIIVVILSWLPWIKSFFPIPSIL